ncbi:MAG: hypothetical protein HKK67_05520 [Chlorobiaceae bacterium]|nr:hypothetical protein [Chlorobiaceae bacterium]
MRKIVKKQKTLNNEKNYFYANMLLFLIWPFAVFINSINYFKYKSAKIFLILFFGLYGYSFILDDARNYDSERYAESFVQMALLPASNFFEIIKQFNSQDGSSIDIVVTLLSFIISRITNNAHILFAVYSIFFGIFNVLSINILYNKYSNNPNINTRLFLLFFLIINPIFNINGIRFWLATWIFFYGAYFVIIDKNYKYLTLTAFAFLVHFSYFSINILLIIYLLIGTNNIFYYSLLAVSYVLPNFLFNHIKTILSYFSLGIQKHVSLYANPDQIKQNNLNIEGHRFELVYIDHFMYWFFVVVILFIVLNKKKIRFDINDKRLYSFIILLLSYVNFVSIIPSGGRFKTLFYLFALAYILIIYTKYKYLKIDNITLIGFFIFIIDFIIVFRMGSENLNVILFLPFTLISQIAEIKYSAFNLIFHWLH